MYKENHRPYHRAPNDRRPAQKKVLTARDVALNALTAVIRDDAYASEALDRALNNARLEDDDRRLAANIFYTAVENRLYIERVFEGFMDTKPEPVVSDILHIAAAQLLFMDRLPDHAVVNEAVKQTRASGRDGLTGLVNAVLHKLIAARDAGIALPDAQTDPVEYLSVKCSVAAPIAKRLIDAYGLERAEKICLWRPEARALTVRPNRLQTDAAAFEGFLTRQGYAWKKGAVPDAYILTGAGSVARSEGYQNGLFSVQSESAMLAAQAVEAKPGMHILDACAAPGGKTCLMAERMNGAGRVFAWDIHPHRVDLMRAAAKRLGLENVRFAIRDASQPHDAERMTMDAVLVDAPCSGLGVIADKPDIKYSKDEAALSALPALQSAILSACADCVKVRGLLVYATCTILPEENEQIVRAFLEAHPQFEPDTKTNWLPEAFRAKAHDGMLTLLPDTDGMPGFFIARMRRKGV